MSDITISQFRQEVTKKLLAAKEEVRKFEGILSIIDSMMAGGEFVVPSTPVKQSVPEIKGHDDKDSVGGSITETIRSADGDFTVQTVARIVRVKFPSVSYAEISKKFAAKAYRLEHRGEIEIVEKGYGRTPHTYRRVIKQEEGKEV